MVEKVFSEPDVYRIEIPLPQNPLKYLNCYVILLPKRNLMIDTGFRQPECLKVLQDGIAELNIDMNRTDLFLTHLHSDHTGLAADIAGPESTVYMSQEDYRYLLKTFPSANGQEGEYWTEINQRFEVEGFPEEELELFKKENPARQYMMKDKIPVKEVRDSDIIRVGETDFKVISVPGHTPGHCCLYYEKKKLLFLGDHVLFDISPNIETWIGMEDSLGSYLKSLEKIEQLDVATVFPGHGRVHISVEKRIKELKKHHQKRLGEIIEIIQNNDGLTAYEIAAKMKWSMRGKVWIEFPIQQKWFAMGETLAHLEHLLNLEKIVKIKKNGIWRYFLRMPGLMFST